MRIECASYNSNCKSHCFLATTEDDLSWLKSIGTFDTRYCVYAKGRAKWYPVGFIGLMMKAIEESSNGQD